MIDVLLESDRLLIRPFQMGDEAAILELNSNPEVQKYTGDTMLNTLEDAKKALTEVILRDYEKHGYGRLAVIHKPDDKLIGFTGFKYLPEAQGESDLGYRFLPQYWRQGIATESAIMAMKYGFEDLGLKTIYGFAEIENIASGKILKNLGFSLIKIAPYPGEEDQHDVEWYTMTAEQYAAQE